MSATNSSQKKDSSIQETNAMRDAKSFLEIFYQREQLHPDKAYLYQPEGERWHSLSWSEVGHQARCILTALRQQGLKPGDHVGLLSKNCAQWFIADLAILMGGYVSVPFYPTLSASDLNEVIDLSGVKALFVGKLENWDSQKQGVPASVACIAFPHYPGNSKVVCQLQWDKLLSNCAPAEEVHHPERDEIFTILYTSGTTGTPKGVMLSYQCANEVMQHERQQAAYGIYQGVAERVISYLPLNHIAERIVSEISSIVAGSEVYFSESLDRFAANLQDVQPTLFFAVPRIWTKIQQGVLAKIPQKKLDLLLSIPLVNTLLKNKIRQGLGLKEVRAAISGAAPISASVLDWFAKLDIHIQEVYGATELAGGVTYNSRDNIVPGTVGKALHGVEIDIDPATDEVLIKAPWVMKAYYNDPEKTAEVMRGDYYRTGDTGRLDAEGNLVITGRIKDTFKTSKGKFITPVPIEQKLGRNFFIEQAVVAGFGLNQPIALISLAENTAALETAEIEKRLLETLDDVNAEAESYAKISTLVVFRTPWPEDSGLFTPTLKIKRHAVDEHFRSHYERWADHADRLIWSKL